MGSAKIGAYLTSFDVGGTQRGFETAVHAVAMAAYLSCRASHAQNVRFSDDYVLCGWLPDCKDFVGVTFRSGAVLCPAC